MFVLLILLPPLSLLSFLFLLRLQFVFLLLCCVLVVAASACVIWLHTFLGMALNSPCCDVRRAVDWWGLATGSEWTLALDRAVGLPNWVLGRTNGLQASA